MDESEQDRLDWYFNSVFEEHAKYRTDFKVDKTAYHKAARKSCAARMKESNLSLDNLLGVGCRNEAYGMIVTIDKDTFVFPKIGLFTMLYFEWMTLPEAGMDVSKILSDMLMRIPGATCGSTHACISMPRKVAQVVYFKL